MSTNNPATSLDKLKRRVERLFSNQHKRIRSKSQLKFNFKSPDNKINKSALRNEVADFINRLLKKLDHSDIYLFGGALRDLALLGRSGFNSDIDLVVDGDLERCLTILAIHGAKKNKFGGYRVNIAGWPIDIWGAKDTWAIKQGIVHYDGISSLINTTVLNWDAILMNWRTGDFICRDNYLDDLLDRKLDIVLIDNPNPIGMIVRVFRHLCTKDAKSITPAVANYLADCSIKYTLEEIRASELASYGNCVIEPAIYRLFEKLKSYEELDMPTRFKNASDDLIKEGTTLSFYQFELELE